MRRTKRWKRGSDLSGSHGGQLPSRAASGYLTYHGTLTVIPPPPFQARVEYRGVICP
jgi:hypothetical protein